MTGKRGWKCYNSLTGEGCGRVYEEDPGVCDNCNNTVFQPVEIEPDREDKGRGFLDRLKQVLGF